MGVGTSLESGRATGRPWSVFRWCGGSGDLRFGDGWTEIKGPLGGLDNCLGAESEGKRGFR